MIQKIIKVGNSLAVTIPKLVAEGMGISTDTLIDVQPDMATGKIILDTNKQHSMIKDAVDPEVYAVAKDLLKRYLPAFKELAKK
jgi:antitoxin component of MazEF toxin-antitoxin module